MKSSPAGLSPAFVERQREALFALREELIRAIEVVTQETSALVETLVDEPMEAAEQADKRTLQENEEALITRNRQRLGEVERALKRIEQGTYGVSVASGAPIPKARLEAVPEAAFTLEEEAEREKRRAS